MFVALARSSAPRDGAPPEVSSLPGLAKLLQQDDLSGRDFQSIFGPATQFAAWAATAVTKTRSSADAYGMIVFVFCAASAILIALMLLVCNRLTWQDCAILYAFCFFLNLFFSVFDFRIALLLLSAAFSYRVIASETMRDQLIWATVTGLLCFGSQLVAIELGIYSVIVVVCSLIVGAFLTRNAWALVGIEVAVATLAVANIALVLFFKITSADYVLMFDYPSYSLELLRSYHGMGTLWQLPWRETVILIVATAFVIVKCVISARSLDPLDASLFASIGFVSLVWLKSAFISSDVPHISAAFTPMVVLLALFATTEWASKPNRVAWGVAVAAVLFAWPSFNFSAPLDMFQVAGKVPMKAALKKLYAPGKDPAGVKAGPIFAPVLETYMAATDSLERYYIQAIDRKRPERLGTVWGPDTGVAPQFGDIQPITRTPNIFEYVYRRFELASKENTADGRYELRERYQPRDVDIVELPFAIPQQVVDSGTVKLNAPSACGLVRVQMRIEYTKNPMIFRPSGVELSVRRGEQMIWRGVVLPRRPNQSFVTLVSPLPLGTFHKVFDYGQVQGMLWDQIEYRALPSDLLGSKPARIRVEALQCLDPQRFVEVLPAL
jgi:hypothetical protein